MDNTDRSDGTIKSVRTTFTILEHMMESNGCGVTELSEALDIPKSTAHRYLATLTECGYVVQNGDRYDLSLSFKHFSDYIYNRDRIYSIAKGKVKSIAEQTGERVQYVDEEHFEGIPVHRSIAKDAVKINDSIGRKLPLHSTAAGKCILAYKSDNFVSTFLEVHGLPEQTSFTITDSQDLENELAEIRERGYAFNEQENINGLRAVGVPILDANDDPLGAISISGPTNRMTESTYREEYPVLLLGIANEIELTLEYSE